jgi:hypothetical protein
MNDLVIFLFAGALAMLDAAFLAFNAGTPEAYVWAFLAMCSSALMMMAARPFMPK